MVSIILLKYTLFSYSVRPLPNVKCVNNNFTLKAAKYEMKNLSSQRIPPLQIIEWLTCLAFNTTNGSRISTHCTRYPSTFVGSQSFSWAQDQVFGTHLDGRVGEGGSLGGVGSETALRHVEGFRRIVEGPLEVFWRRKGIHFANDFGRFVSSYPIDFLLIGPANWLVCGVETKKTRVSEWVPSSKVFYSIQANCICSQSQ